MNYNIIKEFCANKKYSEDKTRMIMDQLSLSDSSVNDIRELVLEGIDSTDMIELRMLLKSHEGVNDEETN